MKEQEGVIKYTLDHSSDSIADTICIAEINAWRTLFFKLELIGQKAGRYDGYGFGNISQRINSPNPEQVQFLITGTQTGNLTSLSRQHYCTVISANPDKNTIKSVGESKPSSEALTHASIYQSNLEIQSVIHVHCPEIWNNTARLNLPFTAANIPYGTPEMAIEVKRLLQQRHAKNSGLCSMLGHKDGVFSFSNSMESAAWSIINYYSKAIALEAKKTS
jgi:hypothetical protein